MITLTRGGMNNFPDGLSVANGKSLVNDAPPRRLLSWLEDPDSVTQRMRSVCGDRFRLTLLGQSKSKPMTSEARSLGLSARQYALIREVLLCCDDTPWIFARSVLPLAALKGRYRRITQLRDRPLGDLLFSSSDLRRGEAKISPLRTDRAIHALCADALGHDPGNAWLRRSLFALDESPLLINEVFLPQIGAE